MECVSEEAVDVMLVLILVLIPTLSPDECDRDFMGGWKGAGVMISSSCPDTPFPLHYHLSVALFLERWVDVVVDYLIASPS